MLGSKISIKHSGVLTLLIKNQAPENEIHRVLDSGADVNAYCVVKNELQLTPIQAAADVYSLHLVRLLLERGADVNRPARGDSGQTALQAACTIYSSTQERYSNAIELIKFLIEQGADVNAPPSPKYGYTALQAAAASGNFEVALLLLEHGADINAPPSEDGGFSELDLASLFGKLDMVHFLLDLGALSFYRGESGYRGSIRIAERGGKQATADMIRQYALKDGKSGEELHLHYKQWGHTYSDEGSDSDDTDEISEADFVDPVYWEDMIGLVQF